MRSLGRLILWKYVVYITDLSTKNNATKMISILRVVNIIN